MSLLALAPKARSQQPKTLPDAPEIAAAALGASASPFAATGEGGLFAPIDPSVPASPYHKYILPGQTAPRLSAGEKVAMGMHNVATPFSAMGIVVSAGYSHITNGIPNYGTNSKAFGQRVGATAIKEASDGIFTDSIAASLFREDTRYYEMGDGHPIARRVLYAVTRVLITRTDGGRPTPNFALLAGYGGSAVLSQAYFPQANHGVSQTAMIFGYSLGGAAIGNTTDEFADDIFVWLHLKKRR